MNRPMNREEIIAAVKDIIATIAPDEDVTQLDTSVREMTRTRSSITSVERRWAR